MTGHHHGPLCRTCGKPIAKRVHIHWFGQLRDERRGWYTSHVERVATKAEAQRFTNDEIVSVRLNSDRSINRVGTWDGESYADVFFCKNACATAFGYFAATNRPDLVSAAYDKALRAQEAS
jgi:hypothetical protein